MLEQKLEKIIIDKIRENFSAHEINDCKIFGAWQDDELIKSEEDCSAIVITVKALPRTYETPTVPDAQIEISVSMLVRSDVDFNGKTYLSVSEILSDVFQKWQKKFENPEADFNIDGEFLFTGY